MTGVPKRLVIILTSAALALTCHAGATATPAPSPSAPAPDALPYKVLVSVRDQRLAVVRDGELVARYPVSTSKFGTGDNFGSYKTPLGDLRVYDKIGEDLTPGAVIKHRAATGEVLPVNAPGRDPIVTRVIWLDGLEQQNKNARSRGIYIHGTPEERTIGMPVSWGCIRMRSRDVIKFFDEIPVGTVVSIIPQKLPHMHRYEPPKEQPQPPDNQKPEPSPAAVPSPAPAKPSAPQEKPAEMLAHASTPPPAVAEGPEHGSMSPWKAMKGSFLLANLPGGEPEKRHGGKTAAATQ